MADLPIFEGISAATLSDGGPDAERAARVLEAICEMAQMDSLARDLLDVIDGALPTWINVAAARSELGEIKKRLRNALWKPDSPADRMLRGLAGEGPPSEVRYLIPLVRGSLGGTIATLNYDNAVELAGGPRVTDHRDQTKHIKVPDERPGIARLLKLHGSLDWKRVADDVLSGAAPLGVVEYDPAIVFGAGNKLRYHGPFLSLIAEFHRVLDRSSHVVTIGYSFRDPHITNALRIWAITPVPGMTKSLRICMGPAMTTLPPEVADWERYDSTTIELYVEPASSFIRTVFPRP